MLGMSKKTHAGKDIQTERERDTQKEHGRRDGNDDNAHKVRIDHYISTLSPLGSVSSIARSRSGSRSLAT